MAQPADVESLRRGYEAFNRGDVEAALRNISPEVEARDRAEIPDPGVYRGLEELREAFDRSFVDFEHYRIEPEEFIEAGEYIVVVARQSGRGRTSGAPVEGTIVHAWRLRDGQVIGMRAFSDRDEALKAVGEAPVDREGGAPESAG